MCKCVGGEHVDSCFWKGCSNDHYGEREKFAEDRQRIREVEAEEQRQIGEQQ